MEIANCILDVPLFDVFEEDKLVWCDDVNGHYSVRSGYNMLQKYTRRGDENSPRGLERSMENAYIHHQRLNT
jgi:hypothetical protein